MFALPLLVKAQAPGYIGKKVLIGYGCEVSPALKGATSAIPFNLTQQLFFEYTTKANLSLGAALKYANTSYDNRAKIGKLGSPSSYYKIHAFSFAPYFKFFSKRFVAPWGKYWMLGPVWNATVSKHDAYMHYRQQVSDHDTLIMNFGPDKQLHNSFDLLIGRGKSRIFGNKIVVDYGFNFQVISALISILDPDYNSLHEDNYIEKTAIRRVQGLNSFNAFLKVGYLF